MRNLDTITVTSGSETFEDGKVIDYITLVLNGKPVEGVFDAQLFACSGKLKRVTLEVMTCSCGIAGCAGIFEGTAIRRRRYTVEWRDIDCGLPKRFYAFDAKVYDAVIEKTLLLMRDIAVKREAGERNYEDYDGLFNFWTVKEFEDTISNSEYHLMEWHGK